MKILFILVLLVSPAWASDTVPVVVPFSAGGATDQAWRALLPYLNHELRPQRISLVTEYLPGAGGSLGAAAVARRREASLLFTSASLVMATVTTDSAGYDIGSFRLAGYAGYFPLVLFGSATHVWSWTDLKQQCRRRSLIYGSSGIGSMTHVSTQHLLQQIACKTTAVPYRSASQAIPDLVSGDLDLVMDHPTGLALSMMQQGRIRPLVVLSDRKLDTMPTVPTVSQVGVVSDFRNWQILVANPAMSPETLSLIQRAFLIVLSQPQPRRDLAQLGLVDMGNHVAEGFLHDQRQRFLSILQ